MVANFGVNYSNRVSFFPLLLMCWQKNLEHQDLIAVVVCLVDCPSCELKEHSFFPKVIHQMGEE
jgi:hypothetical protein